MTVKRERKHKKRFSSLAFPHQPALHLNVPQEKNWRKSRRKKKAWEGAESSDKRRRFGACKRKHTAKRQDDDKEQHYENKKKRMPIAPCQVCHRVAWSGGKWKEPERERKGKKRLIYNKHLWASEHTDSLTHGPSSALLSGVCSSDFLRSAPRSPSQHTPSPPCRHHSHPRPPRFRTPRRPASPRRQASTACCSPSASPCCLAAAPAR